MGDKTALKFTVFADYHYKEGMYLSPVSDIEAIVEIDSDGNIEIFGTKSDWIHGVVPENLPASKMPKITSVKF